MVPTLDREELQKRMAHAANPDLANRILRKRNFEDRASRRYKRAIGASMKSKIQPRDGLENKLDA